MMKMLFFSSLFFYGNDYCSEPPAITHKALYGSTLKIYSNYEGKSRLELEAACERLYSEFRFANRKDFDETRNFLISICPGQGKLELADHITYCQAIEDLCTCFCKDAQNNKTIINKHLLKASLELVYFKKHCTEYDIETKEKVANEAQKTTNCLKIKMSATQSLFKLLRIISITLKLANDSKDAAQLLSTVGNCIQTGILKLFGAHKTTEEFIFSIDAMLTFIGHNKVAIYQAISLIKMILLAIAIGS